MPEDVPKLRITYREADEHRTIPVTGALGGPTPTGHVQISLYHERLQRPSALLRDQDTGAETIEGGTLGVIVVERVVEFSMLLRTDIARAIGQWLLEQAKRAEEQGSSNAQRDASQR